MWVEHHTHPKGFTIQDPDRWCSYTERGQELWQVACQWVWNLRLSLGKTMQGGRIREIEWAPVKAVPPFLVPEESPPQEYGPWCQRLRNSGSSWFLVKRWENPSLICSSQAVPRPLAVVYQPLSQEGKAPTTIHNAFESF